MIIRKTDKSDLVQVMKIIKQAQEFLKEKAIDQWQNNYPNENVISTDIENGESYVLEDEGKIIGTTVVTFAGEKTYDKIYEGKWLSNGNYGAIHRIAIDNRYKGHGAAHKIIKFAEEICIEKNIYSLKVDTHEDNIPMQKMLKKNGFKNCGVIYLEDGSKRIALEKILKK
ncbi:Ribosomal protein S18 acetylase RimI [Clostridium sp. DSM 8431]|uniref:GNAT family N-acetyltransferase n=1 Tax=Clostridium sp. DSM 8431 TaxID=1761781 RepID=UPI0008F297BB|nr:GNAT family N-acetyltransferase [Clostridium sp. DSM 8431]SFU64680.1 Ribosomal protein S18 acetylase RimI [Clostridium sp. DSM 8431]